MITAPCGSVTVTAPKVTVTAPKAPARVPAAKPTSLLLTGLCKGPLKLGSACTGGSGAYLLQHTHSSESATTAVLLLLDNHVGFLACVRTVLWCSKKASLLVFRDGGNKSLWRRFMP